MASQQATRAHKAALPLCILSVFSMVLSRLNLGTGGGVDPLALLLVGERLVSNTWEVTD